MENDVFHDKLSFNFYAIKNIFLLSFVFFEIVFLESFDNKKNHFFQFVVFSVFFSSEFIVKEWEIRDDAVKNFLFEKFTRKEKKQKQKRK